MITIHHLNNSRSQRVLWLLEELGLDYEIKTYQRDPKTIRAPQALKQIHALGKAPIVQDGDVVVAESGAIIEYLVDTYGADSLKPALGSPAHRAYSYWLHFSEGSLMPPMVMSLVFQKVKESPMPFFIKPIARGIADKVMSDFVEPEIALGLSFVNDYLSEHDWFAGQGLTGADVQMSFPLEACVARGIVNEKKYPHIYSYVKLFQAREQYLSALAKGGNYDYGPTRS